MKNTLIVDGNSLAHANHNGTRLTVGTMEVQAIYGMLRSIAALKGAYPGWDMIVLWDGRAQWRFDLHPEYKGNREAKDAKQEAHKAAFKAQSPFIRKALSLLGVKQLLVESAEADDVAGYLSKRLSAAGAYVVLVSGDKDWIQLVNPKVIWFDPIRDRKVSEANFFEFTGYRSPQAFIDGKALTGDTSDNIPGVGGIGEKGAPVFLAEFGSVEAFFKAVDSGTFKPKKKAHQNLASPEGRDAFRRNRQLMNLLDVPKPPSDHVTVMKSQLDPNGFKVLCEKLAFRSFLREFDEFIGRFQGEVA